MYAQKESMVSKFAEKNRPIIIILCIRAYGLELTQACCVTFCATLFD